MYENNIFTSHSKQSALKNTKNAGQGASWLDYLGSQWCDLGVEDSGTRMKADILFHGVHPEDQTGAKLYGDFTVRNVVNGK